MTAAAGGVILVFADAAATRAVDRRLGPENVARSVNIDMKMVKLSEIHLYTG